MTWKHWRLKRTAHAGRCDDVVSSSDQAEETLEIGSMQYGVSSSLIHSPLFKLIPQQDFVQHTGLAKLLGAFFQLGVEGQRHVAPCISQRRHPVRLRLPPLQRRGIDSSLSPRYLIPLRWRGARRAGW